MMTERQPRLTPGLLLLLATASGLVVANLYYNQSLLASMSRDLHVTVSVIGAVAVATQLGYATGLLLLVPLADLIDRKLLIIGSAGAATLVLIALMLTPGPLFAVSMSYLLGLVSITPQLAVPFAAHLAESDKRGQAVGFVMGGLMVGILFARSAAGFLGDWIGWRGVFAVGAALNLIITLCLGALPKLPKSTNRLSYGQLLRSMASLLAREPILQRHGLLGALSFGAFSVFWTTLAVYLAARPEHYGGNVVGLFGLIAVAGAAAAPISGYLSDHFSARLVNGVSLSLMTIAFLMMSLTDYSLIWLVFAVFLMDAGAQGNQISNQTRIYTLQPEMRNRITSVYMSIYFIGGAIGSGLASQAWATWNWRGVWVLGALMSALGLLVLFVGQRDRR